MKRLAIALILFAGCSESTTPTPVSVAPVVQPAAPALPAPKIDRASLRKYLEFEFNTLLAGKETTTFYNHGFADTGPHAAWLQKIRDKKASLPPGPERMAVGMLEELALEYHASRGASTEKARHWTSELMQTIGEW